MTRVLVVATSRKTRGGITSVIKAHETGEQWQKYHCHWVQTHRDGNTIRKIWYFVTGLVDFLTRLPFYDIVHIHTADYGTEKRKRIFAHLTKLYRKKLIVHLHSSGQEFSIGGEHRDLYEYSFSHADKIILLSNTWKDEAIKAFPQYENKMTVLYNPCPIINNLQELKRQPYVLFAGTLNHRKGYDDLIKAFSKISNKYPEWRLKFAGNGDIEKGKEIARELGVEQRVDFLGWISGKEKDIIFRQAAIYCLPSYSEGFPMGVLDAWAYGLPVVTTPVGGIPDVGIDGENLMIFTPGDIETLSNKIEILISDKRMYEKISKASVSFAKNEFSIDTITMNLSKIYASLC